MFDTVIPYGRWRPVAQGRVFVEGFIWLITLHLVPCVRLTLNCCSFPVSVHVSVLAASLLPLQLSGNPFLWPFAAVSPLTVFGANSNLSSKTLLSGLLNAPPHPAPQIRRVSRWHYALYKFTNLLAYLLIFMCRRCWRFILGCSAYVKWRPEWLEVRLPYVTSAAVLLRVTRSRMMCPTVCLAGLPRALTETRHTPTSSWQETLHILLSLHTISLSIG